MTAELRLLSIPEIMGMASGSVDIANENGEVNWWGILSAKVSAGHFDALVDEIAENGFGMPIVLCDRYSNGEYVIGNGHHRLAAAILLGLWKIPVLVSEGSERDDFMQANDSMDDYNRPIVGYSYDYWELLSDNLGSKSYRAAWEQSNNTPEQFWCEFCQEFFNVDNDCCAECHYDLAHPVCEICCARECGGDHSCRFCGAEANEYHEHLIGCPEREYEILACPDGMCINRFRLVACDHTLSAIHGEALAEQAARCLEMPAKALAAWHPDSVLADAYGEHSAWLADAPLRAARARYEALVKELREAIAAGVSDTMVMIIAGNLTDAWREYSAL